MSDIPTTPGDGERISELLLEKEMQESYLNYSLSVIYSRALPDVRDGLKPSQRRILYAMHQLNLGPRAKFRLRAHDGVDEIGAGIHDRFIVGWDRFKRGVAAKTAKVLEEAAL